MILRGFNSSPALDSLSSQQKGSITVQLVVVFPLIIALFLICSDIIQICVDWLGVERVAHEAARAASLGATSSESTPAYSNRITQTGNLLMPRFGLLRDGSDPSTCTASTCDTSVEFTLGSVDTFGFGKQAPIDIVARKRIYLSPAGRLFFSLATDSNDTIEVSARVRTYLEPNTQP